MAVAESSRLAGALKKEGVPVKKLVLNQVVPLEAKQKFLELKIKDQEHAFDIYKSVRGVVDNHSCSLINSLLASLPPEAKVSSLFP